ncbi:hypothetical protein E5676_scaffold195G00090 [Cucumis melo var. makuwa]|uniref:Uncharacterized protein n=2 Tax=Cucumis melo TaxID=3656 RepID=A0A5D3DG68_CUCMM|nr:hypothetical protein E6C27_scaffold34G001510 [Cucumis melo var. makuwa]TYK22592.1 hypothetical protein E5676_scaffold195G00090 [Cucumis melo var. makuwa]
MARWLKKLGGLAGRQARLGWGARGSRGRLEQEWVCGWYGCGRVGQVDSWRMGARFFDDVTLFRLRRTPTVDDGTG